MYYNKSIINFQKGTIIMSQKNRMNIDNPNLVDEDDYEYEKKLAEQEQERRRKLEEKELAREQQRAQEERQAQKERDKKIAQDKLELLQLKNGVIGEDEATIKEEHTEAVKLTGTAWLSNFWYHNKFMILFITFIVAVVAFITYSEITRERADLTIMMIADNGLAQRQDELEEFFEKYTDDIDGNGYVHVAVLCIPISDRLDYQTLDANTSKFVTQIQAGDAMIVITDSNTDEEYKALMDATLQEDFPGNKYVDELGFSFNSKVMAEELKYEYMPNDVHMSIRFPAASMNIKLEESQENFDTSYVVFKRIVEDITKRCEETNDPGLETEPVKYETDESAVEGSSSEQK